jgi:hypothetical protein
MGHTKMIAASAKKQGILTQQSTGLLAVMRALMGGQLMSGPRWWCRGRARASQRAEIPLLRNGSNGG